MVDGAVAHSSQRKLVRVVGTLEGIRLPVGPRGNARRLSCKTPSLRPSLWILIQPDRIEA